MRIRYTKNTSSICADLDLDEKRAQDLWLALSAFRSVLFYQPVFKLPAVRYIARMFSTGV